MKQRHRTKTKKSRKVSEKSNIKLVLAFLFLAILISLPSIYRAISLAEIYLYKDVREQTLNTVFFLREQYGLTIGDLRIKDVVVQENSYIITVHEYYHGFLDRTQYDDLNRDYIIEYNKINKEFTVLNIIDKDQLE